jgi:hypothetical protein
MRKPSLIYLIATCLAFFSMSCKKDNGTTPEGESITKDITVFKIPVSATPQDPENSVFNGTSWSLYPYIRYGAKPSIVVAPNSDGSYSVAWMDTQTKMLYLTKVDANHQKMGNDILLYNKSLKYFGGFTSLGGSGYAFSVVEESQTAGDNLDHQYKFITTNNNGNIQSEDILTGTTDLEALWSKQSPMDFSSSRLLFNPNVNRVALYFGHLMKWDDGVKHQGGYFQFYDRTQEELIEKGKNGWLGSHNFDHRVQYDATNFVITGHGDAYPRSIFFEKIDSTGKHKRTNIFDIPGAVGDNETDTQLGGLVVLQSGYAVSFATSHGRNKRDAAVFFTDKSGNVTKEVYLTSYNSNKDAVNIKAALLGQNVLVAWNLVEIGTSKQNAQTFFAVLSNVSSI